MINSISIKRYTTETMSTVHPRQNSFNKVYIYTQIAIHTSHAQSERLIIFFSTGISAHTQAERHHPLKCNFW